MRLRAEDRAVAAIVGFTLLFGFLVLLFALWQAQVVPQQNSEVEFNHNQEVKGQMHELRGAVVSVPGGGPDRSVSVPLGTTYPERTIFVNPGPGPGGHLRATAPHDATVENAVASGDAGDFWTGETRNVTTRGLEYHPYYVEFRTAPDTEYENTVLLDRAEDAVITQTDQRLIDDRRITLVALQGDYQRATIETVPVDVRAVSSSDRSVAITGQGDDPVVITLPTELSGETWRSLLAEEIDDGHVENVSVVEDGDVDRLRIELDGTETYRLRMALAGITTGVDDPGAAYLTRVEGDDATIDTGEDHDLVAEVRDRFNNPVTGTELTAEVVDGPGSVDPGSQASDDRGRGVFTYSASGPGKATVRVEFGDGTEDPEYVEFTVTVEGGGGGGPGGGGPRLDDEPDGGN